MVWDENLDPQPSIQVLMGEEQPVIMVTHDKCTFNANDGSQFIESHDNHNPIRKKGLGQGLHVSKLLTMVGRLGGGSVCEILKCRGDIWWDGVKPLAQIKTKAILTFEAEYPGCQALFMFDNAKDHVTFAEDLLRVSKMNLEDRGKNVKPMQRTFVQDKEHPEGGWYQRMVTQNGVLKGLKAVLTECGLWPIDDRRFLRQYTIRSTSGKLKPNSKCLQGGNCCARVLLATQSDFQAQNRKLQEAIKAAGHLVLFYPPFHCELNFIEYFWGAAKQYTREHCE